MGRLTPKLIMVTMLSLMLGSTDGLAQAPVVPAAPPPANAPATAPVTQSPPNFQEGWPRPPEQPGSLFSQAIPAAPFACAPLPGPFFENDPLLDPPQFDKPGFFAGLEIQAVGPHIFNTLANGAPVGMNPVDSIRIPAAGLDWTVAPVAEVGYRLPSGFGEFSVVYRGMATSGASTTIGPDGLASLSSRFDLNTIDLDYASREFTPWEHWGMKWRLGVRTAFLYYDNRLNQPFPAAAGSGIVQQSAFNTFNGVGPHAALELDRDLFVKGLTIVGKLDFGSLLGRIRQGVTETTFANGTIAGFVDNGQTVPYLAGQFGLNYAPPGTRLNLFAGGLYEYWWNVGRMSTFSVYSRGELSLTGLALRLQYNY